MYEHCSRLIRFVLVAGTSNFEVLLGSNIVESLGFQLAILFVHDTSFHDIIVEGGSLNVVRTLELSIDDNSYITIVIND